MPGNYTEALPGEEHTEVPGRVNVNPICVSTQVPQPRHVRSATSLEMATGKWAMRKDQLRELPHQGHLSEGARSGSTQSRAGRSNTRVASERACGGLSAHQGRPHRGEDLRPAHYHATHKVKRHDEPSILFKESEY